MEGETAVSLCCCCLHCQVHASNGDPDQDYTFCRFQNIAVLFIIVRILFGVYVRERERERERESIMVFFGGICYFWVYETLPEWIIYLKTRLKVTIRSVKTNSKHDVQEESQSQNIAYH